MYHKKSTSFSKAISFLMIAAFLFISLAGFSQTNISGKVIDSSGSPLIGASVKIKGTNKATKTNEQGAFSLQNVASASPVLIISYVGFEDKEISASTENLIVTLKEKSGETQEVVVTGV